MPDCKVAAHLASYPWCVWILNPGCKSHEEFPTIPVESGLNTEDLKKQGVRGVYGYFCFGEEINGQVWWHPAYFLNYERQILYPPDDVTCVWARMWLRPKVDGWAGLLQTKMLWLPPV